MNVLSLQIPDVPAVAPPFARGSRRLAAPRRPVDRVALVHHLAVLPMSGRTFALVTGNAPGELAADAALARWCAARLRALAGRLVAGETAAAPFRRESAGLVGFGPDPAPSGEDALVGLTAAATKLASAHLLAERAVAALLASLDGLSATGAEHDAARLLADAAHGGFPAPVARLVELLGDPEVEDSALKDVAVRLAAGGTRPGADALAGIVALVRDVAVAGL